MTELRIGEVAHMLDIGIDTLRYYEKCQVLPPVRRSASGVRIYTEKDVSRIRFVRRAQKMNFALAEIRQLLRFRENPRRARDEVRALAASKLTETEKQLAELAILRDELTLLINLCRSADDGCPILEGIEDRSSQASDDL